jgi:hypothetical protein
MTLAEKAALAEGEEKAALYQAEQEARADDDPLKMQEVAAAEAAEAAEAKSEEDDS